MNTRKRAVKFGLALSLGLLGAAGAAGAQTSSMFDKSDVVVLSTNIDFVGTGIGLDTTALYVDIAYNINGCGRKQLRFRLSAWDHDQGKRVDTGKLVIERVFANANFVTNNDTVLELDNETATAGYTLKLRPANVANVFSEKDSLKVTAESYVHLDTCKMCGVWSKDLVFDSDKSKWLACPYPKDRDMVFCHPRKANDGKYWEGWIQDPRDCKYYKIVQMPTGAKDTTRWWFAQNLRYEKSPLRLASNANHSNNFTAVWAPGVRSGEYDNSDPNMSFLYYGGLYTWLTAVNPDGVGESAITQSDGSGHSTTRGVCPAGWVIPNNRDWADLLNYQDVSPSYHNTSLNSSAVNADSLQLGVLAGKHMKSVASCAHLVTTVCAGDDKPYWLAVGSATEALGVDKYGFSALPSGARKQDGANGAFVSRGVYFQAWSATAPVDSKTFSKKIVAQRGNVTHYRNTDTKEWGLAVRCVAESLVAEP
jgi:uncharacterized protein (TIGR02145 family)